MSGLEPLAGLSLACNIFQIVGTGREIIRVARQVYQDGVLDPALADRAEELKALSDRTRDVLSPAAVAAAPAVPSVPASAAPLVATVTKAKARDKQLADLAEKCQGAARDLQREVNLLNCPPARAQLAATLKTTVKMTWRKRRLNRLDQRLAEAEQTLQTGLMTAIFESSARAETDSSRLRDNIRTFISDYQTNKQKAIDDIKKHVSDQAELSNITITSHVDRIAARLDQSADKWSDTVLQSAASREDEAKLAASRDRLLRCFKFNDLNECRNQVRDSHPETFTWVLKDDADDESETLLDQRKARIGQNGSHEVSSNQPEDSTIS
ncbi:hypothetical protein Micbo1qcDRAFT_220937 [Microdochium bolleyi]|uniref:Uncharacterized protein n=1 Tax=Microdochium bolleyi TaxID=196109 RepID=A0A136JB21_9PEZI|nr:hypothetical protein Micbo1qcDRAFT_220937 [Microdochium bolleyi]